MKNDNHLNAGKYEIEEIVKVSLIEALKPFPDIAKRKAWLELADIGGNLMALRDRLVEDIGMFHELSILQWLVLGMRFNKSKGMTNKYFLPITSRLLGKTGRMANRLSQRLNKSLRSVLETDRDEFYSISDIGLVNLLSSTDTVALQVAVSFFNSKSDPCCDPFKGYIWVPREEGNANW